MFINERLNELQKYKGCLCLHIRPQEEKIPAFIKEAFHNEPSQYLQAYFTNIISKLDGLIMGIKLDVPSFQTFGFKGVLAMERIAEYARNEKIFCIYGAELSTDTKNTPVNARPAKQLGDKLFSLMDAVTVNPYFGNTDGVGHFLMGPSGTGAIVTCKTKGFDSGEFQDLMISPKQSYGYTNLYGFNIQELAKKFELEQVPLWMIVTHRVATKWAFSERCCIAIDSNEINQDIHNARQIIGNAINIFTPYQHDVASLLANGRIANTKCGLIITIADEYTYFPGFKTFVDCARESIMKLKTQTMAF